MILFNLLLRLYPAAFRREFSDEMRRLFIEQRHAARRRGPAAVAGLWTRTITGMVSAAWHERREGRRPASAGLPVGETLLADLRLAVRMLFARPMFTLVVVSALSIGVGGVATIFSGLNALVLRRLPGVSDGERLVLIDRRTPDQVDGVSASVRYFEYLRDQSRTFSGVAVWSRVPLTVVNNRTAYTLSGSIVSDNYFDVLGVRPALGRFFETPAGARMSVEPVIVLSHSTWATRFQGDPSIVGRTVTVNGRPYAVIGVAPQAFRGVFTPLKMDAWVPLGTQPHVRAQRDLVDQPWLWAFGRLHDAVEPSQARSELVTLTTNWSDGQRDRFVRHTNVRLVPLTGLPDDARQALLGFGAVLLGAAGLVLIIAASNVSTLLAMRATARRREMGIRTALGAGRGRLVRQLLTETLVLFLLGGLGGTVLAIAGTSALERLPVPADQGLSLELSPDGRVLLFSIAVSLAAGILFGIVPALRSASRSPVTLLRTASAGGGRRTWTTSCLIVGQMACSLVLLTVAALFVRSLAAGVSMDPGFDPRGISLASFNTPAYGYDDARGREFYLALRQRLELQPGVDAVTFADRVPLTMASSGMTITVPGGGGDGRERTSLSADVAVVDTRYFETLGIRLLAGREFRSSDESSATDVAVVNETFVGRVWPGSSPADAIGRTVLSAERPVTIVGVARDSKYSTPGEPATPYVYRPQGRHGDLQRTVFVRTTRDPADAARLVQDVVSSIDPQLPHITVTTLTQESAISLLPQRTAAIITGVLGVAGVVLAGIGLYGLVSYGVALRLREIGVRLALGASRGDVVRMVLAQGLRLTGAGAALGLITSVFATRLVRSYLLKVSAMDLVAFAAGVVILLAIALIAALLPAKRAGSADPLVVLRTE